MGLPHFGKIVSACMKLCNFMLDNNEGDDVLYADAPAGTAARMRRSLGGAGAGGGEHTAQRSASLREALRERVVAAGLHRPAARRRSA